MEKLIDENITIRDIFDVATLQRIQDSYAKITRLGMGFCDPNGVPITEHCFAHEFCSKYTKGSEIGNKYCTACDSKAARKAAEIKAKYIYNCYNGLVDFVAPIMIGDQLIGSLHGGQVLLEKMNDEDVYKKALDLGIDPDEYVRASHDIPVMSKQEIENQCEFIYQIASFMSSMAYSKYSTKIETFEIEREANMKSDFLANMSHEIRTPMNAVIGMAEMALRENLPSEAREYINQIKTAGNSLLTIINDILDFSKIDSGKMDINLVQYTPVSVVNDVANIIETRIGNKNLELIVDYATDIPNEVMGDSIRIKQIVMNLVNNAVKFTNEGKVTVKVSCDRTSEREILLKVSVEDTGIGIKPEDLGKLFQSFSQVDSKRNRNIEGTGLGLAISKRLVELMNGQIHVESEYGKGSRFSFEVPQLMLVDEVAFEIKDKRQIVAGIFTDNPHILGQIQIDMERLGVECKPIMILDQLNELVDAGAEFLFIDEPMYSNSVQKFASDHPDITCVILAEFKSKLEHDKVNMMILNKPLYSYNMCKIFNHEYKVQENDTQKEMEFDFVAPEAEVLVVDDNAINLTVAEGLMRPLQMRVDTALSGQEAVNMISLRHYDLILMDHMMPGLDGVETTHIIRRMHEEYNDVPIIALTANAMEETRSMFLVEGMNDFIAKPIELNVLIEKLKQWLPPDKMHPISEEEKQAIKESLAEPGGNSELKKLRDTGELDIDYSLDLLGSESLFWQVLEDYYKVIDKKVDIIAQYYNEMNWDSYAIEVHALKSASKQIGAMELSELAALLEKSTKEKDYGIPTEKTDEMLRMYRHYKSVLAPFLEKDEEEVEKVEADPELINQIFIDMKNALDDLDMDGVEDCVEQLSHFNYPDDQLSLYDRLADEAEEFNVDACIEIIHEWLELL